ncbi:MBL fold metallo-hydrolase [Mycolicibacterium confluentis]|uniref:MBL fold metallo-hydrolase n=1 Tax=Mycolicibacterium confluentis TaxID=28047 RepID=A0A7I7Y524_9MYCO|nr:MBL fold metallo-hydrolase [Mycolicibacterium confluentis]MCV7319163.1 MBL fold metallo-hydrolase [Mycolicibacterium confluentis]ORV24880.1 MBL fold metallo-hydrolase [Mycolicibacterium confluentis]BBZ36777.1 MBL fold metallo-hydrolase [Mycolicibacterium confluentis]
MKQIRSDLWETRTDSPFPGLTTHGYVWTGRTGGNVLFYSTATDADFDEIDHLGGVTDQYLSHRDEAGPMLKEISARFGTRLHAPSGERTDIEAHAPVDVPLRTRHVDDLGIEVIPTPGHSPASTCYLVTAVDGTRYLFTGDTLIHGADGHWFAGFIPPISEAGPLSESLRLLATVTPDVVVSSAFTGDSGVHEVEADAWAACVQEALAGIG